MGTTIQGKLDASGLSFGIAVARFNHFITEKLLVGAVDCLVRHGADEADIDTVWTPGAFELPSVVKRLVVKPYSAVIVLGCVIRGGTPHFEYVAGEAAKGIGQIALSADQPVSFGVLTCDSIEQAIERAGSKAGNKGADAALAAIEMAHIFAALEA